MENFESFDLPNSLQVSLKKMGFTLPTPIQSKAIPFALQGRDIIASAQTGTGKTMAFLIPVITKLLLSPQSNAIILTPTRELAMQIEKVIIEVSAGISDISSVLLIGGAPIFKQIKRLKTNPRIIVGTPGRINDHLIRKSLKLSNIEFFILDESDRMLDMGFTIQLDDILKHMPAKRQTLMFSATFSKKIIELSRKYLQEPERISIGAPNVVAANIKQDIIRTSAMAKYDDLVSELDKRDGSIIIFVNTKIVAKKLTDKLGRSKHSVSTLHGDIEHNKRKHVINDFRSKKFRVMIATDVASRGLDIDHIRHVINYDLPQFHEDYIHRIGRTGRAESSGSALNFIMPSDTKKWQTFERLLDPTKKHNHTNKDTKFKATKKKKRFRSRPS